MSRHIPARPRVLANFAMSFDGKTAPPGGGPSLFSSKRDKRRLIEIRAMGDALIIGASTLAADTMTMGIPDAALRRRRIRAGFAEYPLRVIFSNSGRVDPEWKVFGHDFSPIILFTATALDGVLRREIEARGVEIVRQRRAMIDIPSALGILAGRGVRVAVCEGGPRLMRSFFRAGCVDELFLTWCPPVFGGAETPRLCGARSMTFPRALRAGLMSFRAIDGECFLHYKFLPTTPSHPSAAGGKSGDD